MAHAVFKLDRPEGDDSETAPLVQDIASRDAPIARAAVGEWIIVYRPRRDSHGETSGFYVGFADLVRLDPVAGTRTFRPTLRDYWEFDEPVRAYAPHGVFEQSFNQINRRSVSQRTARPLSESEFAAILEAGIEPYLPEPAPAAGLAEAQAPFFRERRKRIVSIPVREALLRSRALIAYDGRCCITGWQFLDGSGNVEAQASHWQSVAAGGPDSLANVSLVCSIVHWMIERGELTLADDDTILVKPRQSWFVKRFNPRGVARLPHDASKRPTAQFLRHHRENVFGRS